MTRRPWLDIDIAHLERLCTHRPALSWAQIGHILKRPPSGCYERAALEGIEKLRCKPREKWKDIAA